MINRTTGLRDWAVVVLRLALGGAFIVHGYAKLFPSGPAGFAGFVQSLGFPAPQALAWIVSLLEFGGGIAMVLGLFVRPIGILYIVEMLVTAFRVKMARGVGFIDRSTGWEVDLLLAAIALALVLLGSGAFGLDAALRSKKGTRFR